MTVITPRLDTLTTSGFVSLRRMYERYSYRLTEENLAGVMAILLPSLEIPATLQDSTIHFFRSIFQKLQLQENFGRKL